MWLYFLERENEKVVIPSDQILLDATRETQKELERFNIKYTLTYTHIEDLEYAKQTWTKDEYEVASMEWLAEAIAGWHCEIEEKREVQQLLRYEDIFNDKTTERKNRKRRRNRKQTTQTYQTPTLPEMDLE